MPQVCVRDCVRDSGVLSCTPDLRDATCDPDFHFLCVFELHGLVQVWAQVSPAPPPPWKSFHSSKYPDVQTEI